MKAGDVAILPAGTGHRRLEASDDFQVVVGPIRSRARTTNAPRTNSIPKTLRWRQDPVYGKGGSLLSAWRKIKRRVRKS
jgi:uncharacterized protein YjlB